jgi:hypothetical protein
VTEGSASHTDGNIYGNYERCTITATQDLLVHAEGGFNTESGFDYITINNVRYMGTNAPSGVSMSSGDTMTWYSDGSVTRGGWVLCAHHPSPPALPPPTPPPAPPISSCDAGSTCGLCFMRASSAQCPTMCTNTGNYFTNVCDDGGPGAEYSRAAFGADCNDCGVRIDPSVMPCSMATEAGSFCVADTTSPVSCGLSSTANCNG